MTPAEVRDETMCTGRRHRRSCSSPSSRVSRVYLDAGCRVYLDATATERSLTTDTARAAAVHCYFIFFAFEVYCIDSFYYSGGNRLHSLCVT